MKKVVILQKYLTPYRVPLFNRIAQHPEVDLTIVYYGKSEARRKWSTFPDRTFTEVQTPCVSLRAGYEWNIEMPLFLLKELRRIRPDIIICAPDNGGIAAFFHTRKRPSHFAIWSEATPVSEGKVSFFKGPLRQIIYRNAAGFLVPGSLSADYIRQYQPNAVFHHAPNTVEEERFRLSKEELPAKFSTARIILTFSGSLIERKGILLLLEAFTRLLRNQPELRTTCLLRVIGTGPLDISSYQADGIEIAGFCEGQAYANYFRESHIFVLPSLHDNNPLTVVEALFSGNVIVVSDGVGSHPEAVRGNGCVVPSDSVDELVRSLDEILTLPRSKLLLMAAESIDIAREFSLDRSVSGFMAEISGGSCINVADSRQAR